MRPPKGWPKPSSPISFPKSRRGTALGWYNGLTGFIALPANLLAAWLWTQVGPTATFGLGAWMGAIAFGLLVAWWPLVETQRCAVAAGS